MLQKLKDQYNIFRSHKVDQRNAAQGKFENQALSQK